MVSASRGARAITRANLLAADALLVVEFVLLASLAGPQPAGWVAAARYAGQETGSNGAAILTGIAVAVAGSIATIAAARRVDVERMERRCAAGREPVRNVFEYMLAAVTVIVAVCFALWFFLVARPGLTATR